jgi:hypothetical protein
MKPGLTMIEICERAEHAVRTLIKENGLKAGTEEVKFLDF